MTNAELIAALEKRITDLEGKFENLAEIRAAREEAERYAKGVADRVKRDAERAEQAELKRTRLAQKRAELDLHAITFPPSKTEGSVRRTLRWGRYAFDTFEPPVVVDRKTRDELADPIARGVLVAREVTDEELERWIYDASQAAR